jgi:hypothetical protein
MREFSKVAKILCLAGFAGLSAAASGQVVISQVYGSGSNSGATWTHDYVVLFNKGAAPVNLAGYSIQYASAAGSTWNVDEITAGTIQPGGYFLVQHAGGTVGSALPTPDFIVPSTSPGGIANFSGGAGKVALTSDNVALTGTCPTGGALIDFVGYGTTANCREGAANAPGLGVTIALFRADDGCTDNNENSTDFATGPAQPINSSAPTITCSSTTSPSGAGNTVLNTCPLSNILITFTVTPGSSPTSTGLAVTADLTNIGGFAGEPFFDDGTNGDVTAGDLVFSLSTTVFTGQTGFYAIPAVITDDQSRTGNATATVQVINCNPQGSGSATSACPGDSTLITVNAVPGINPPSTGLAATVDLTNAGGPAAQPLFDDGTNGDVTAGDNIFSYSYSVPALPGGYKALTAVVTDDQNRTSNINFSLYTGDCVPSDSAVVISQGYGGGGNTGATFTHDFIELFNRSGAAVDIGGLSVQYASGETDNNGFDQATAIPAGTILPPGGYYLIQQAAGAGGTDPLPTPDLVGNIALGATRGVFALVAQTAPLGLTACDNPLILDQVGFGNGTPGSDSSAYCAEGTRTPPTSNSTAVIRRDAGCFDTDDNAMDFAIAAPTPRNSASPANPCVTGPVCGTADFDGDGDTGTDADIEAFFACLAGNCCATCFAGGADFNADGDTGTDADIESFFRVLAGGPC